MFENKAVDGYIYYTRYIASFMETGLNPRKNRMVFKSWLEQEHLHLSEEQIKDILFLTENGKLELEDDAKKFVKGLQA